MKQGVLLINLGTPAAATTTAVRSYLHCFLADPRVINLPRFVWLPIRNLMVLPKRPSASAGRYRQIWSKQYGSPLAYYTQKQAAQLQELLPDYKVAYAYSYSKPFIADALAQLEKNRIEKLTIIPPSIRNIQQPQSARSLMTLTAFIFAVRISLNYTLSTALPTVATTWTC